MSAPWTLRLRRLVSLPAARRKPSAAATATTASATAVTRATDLGELDMRALMEESALVYDERKGVFSGWIHVATPETTQLLLSPGTETATSTSSWMWRRLCWRSNRPAFERRFVRLRELVCSFYEADDRDVPPMDKFVIISVERVHHVNKGFLFTDHEDRTVLLHMTMTADFDDWYNAFASAVSNARVAKPRSKTHAHLEPHKTTTHDDATTTTAALENRRRRFTDGWLMARPAPPPPRPPSPPQPLEASILAMSATGRRLGPPPVRTVTIWLSLHYKWWGLGRRVRRYFVLSGTWVSCFAWNQEGQVSKFTRCMTEFRFDPAVDPMAVEIWFADGASVRLSTLKRPQVMRRFVQQLTQALESSKSNSSDAA